MKKIIVTNDCVACGACLGEFMIQSADGKAAPINNGLIDDADVDEIEIDICPVAAIKVEACQSSTPI